MGLMIYLMICGVIIFADIKTNNPEAFDAIEE